MERAGAVGALLLNALVWGLSWWPFRSLASLGLHSLWATALVFLMSCAAIEWARPGALRAAASARPVWALAAAAGATNACFNWAVATGDVVRVVLLFYLMPAWAMGLARLLLGEAVRPAAILRTAVAVAGAAVVLMPPGADWPLPRDLPDALAIAGGFFFALNTVLLRREAHRPGEVRAVGMFAGGAAVSAVLASLLGLAGVVPWPPAPQLAWAGGALGLGVAFLAGNLALQYGAARLPSSVTAVVMLSEVVFAALSSVAAGGAELTARTLAGGALILGASVFAAFERPQPARPRAA